MFPLGDTLSNTELSVTFVLFLSFFKEWSCDA